MPTDFRARLHDRTRGLKYLVVELGHGLTSFALMVTVLVAIPFAALGIGWLAVPPLIRRLDNTAFAASRRAGIFAGVAVRDLRRDLDGPVPLDRRVALMTAHETKRELMWLFLHFFVALISAIAAVALLVGGVGYMIFPLFWWAFPGDMPLETMWTVTSWPLAFAVIAMGFVYTVAGWFLLPRLARAISRWTLILLAPAREDALAERVEALSASRAAALEAHSAELRRIERDLHDGAQNRLVSVVMMIGLARRALDTDPDSAVPYLDRAQDSAAEALAGLRAIVHDIYPPVLDEIGLDGAASALTSRSPVPCVLDAERLRRAPAAVESAAYFVVAEALTNVAKHSAATQVTVVLRTEHVAAQDVLVIEVTDNGRGGAVIGTSGSGLAGISNRVAAFEGSLSVVSPMDGPTIVKVELPCGS